MPMTPARSASSSPTTRATDPEMGGDRQSRLTIPSVFVGQGDGEAIKERPGLGVTAALSRTAAAMRRCAG